MLKTISLLTLLLLTSCATVFNGKRQEVSIKSAADDVEILQIVREKKVIGTIGDYERTTMEIDSNQKIELPRDMIPKRFVTRKDGHKDESFVVFQYKRPPLYILSWFPCGIVYLIPPLMDYGPKAFNYEKSYTLTSGPQYFQNRTDEERYLSLDAIKYSDSIIKIKERHKYKRYIKGAHINEKDVLIDQKKYKTSPIWATESVVYGINRTLKDKGYIDTSNSLIKNNFASNYSLEVEINTYKKKYKFFRTNGYVQVELDLVWWVKNSFGERIEHFSTSSISGQFPSHHSMIEDEALMIKDAMEVGLIDLMQIPEMKDLLRSRDELEISKNSALDTLTLVGTTNEYSNVNEYENAIVKIESVNGMGSGFFISGDGHLITTYRTISDTSEAQVITKDGNSYPFEILRFDKQKDLALLKIEAKCSTPLRFKNTGLPELTDEVYVVGINAQNDNWSVSSGIISGIREYKNGQKIIQTDATVNVGNSGGALVNSNGIVVGVVNAKIVGFGVEGLGFAVPSYNIGEALNVFLD